MILQINDIKTKKTNTGYMAWFDFSYFQAHGKTEGEAIDILAKELHLKIDHPARKA